MVTHDYSVEIVAGDIPKSVQFQERVSIDIETSGLDFRSDSIGSIQVFDGGTVWIVRPPFCKAKQLSDLISSPSVAKVFHHAMFDLRFLCSRFNARPKRIMCTKVAAKIVDRSLERHSLLVLLKKYLGVELDKKMQTSDWMSSQLNEAQVRYAARDTLYLSPLLDAIMTAGTDNQAAEILASFEYLPVRLDLELQGVGDVYSY